VRHNWRGLRGDSKGCELPPAWCLTLYCNFVPYFCLIVIRICYCTINYHISRLSWWVYHYTHTHITHRHIRSSVGVLLVFTAWLHVMQHTVLPRPFSLSVYLSVCLSDACIVTKRKKLVPTFLYHMKESSLSQFSETKNGWSDPLYPKFSVKLTPFEQKPNTVSVSSSIFANSSPCTTCTTCGQHSEWLCGLITSVQRSIVVWYCPVALRAVAITNTTTQHYLLNIIFKFNCKSDFTIIKVLQTSSSLHSRP